MNYSTPNKRKTWAEIARLFLKLGITGFGGPAAHIALMEREVVRRREWVSPQHFLDLVGATNLIPGPNSTEMTMHLGRERGGWPGLILAGTCFILPAALISGTLGWLYSSYGTLPAVQPILLGVRPAILAIILAAVYPLARKAIKNWWLGALGIASLALCLAGVQELYVLFGAGAAGLFKKASTKHLGSLAAVPGIAAASLSGGGIFWIFLKVGALLYGSGYALFAYLDDALVKPGYLTAQQLTDAIAVGQFTPGPVFSAATFTGWQLGGLSGAILATLGIFLPSFFFVALLNPLLPRLRYPTYSGPSWMR